MIWTHSNLARTRPKPNQPWRGPTRLNIVMGPDDSISARACSTRLSSGPLDSTSTWDRSTRHRPRRLNIGLGPNESTSALAQTTQHRPEPIRHRPRPGRFNINMGLLDLTSCRAWSTKHRKGPLDSTSAKARSTQHVVLNIGPGPLDSKSTGPRRLDIARALSVRPHPGLGMTSTLSQRTRHCSGPLGLTSSLATHDIDLVSDDSTSTLAQATLH